MALATADEPRWDRMVRNDMRDRLIRWGLLALGIGALVFVIWISTERQFLNQAQPVQDSTPVSTPMPSPANNTQLATRIQPTETALTPEANTTATPAVAPDFTLPTPAGKMISLSDYSGKPVLINFWATWCVPCRSEMPTIERIYEERDGAFVVLGVNFEETQAAIQPFVKELGLTFPILMDSDDLVSWQYGVIGLPTSVFVTPGGMIYRQYIGPMDEAYIEETLDEMGKMDEGGSTGN